MTQDITKEEAERRLIEKMRAMLDGAVPAPQHAAMMVGYSDFVEAKDMLAQQPKRWTEAEVRREFERDVRRRFGNVVVVDMRIYNTNGTPLHEHSIGKDVERALRLWYGIDDLAGRDESCMSELQYKQINRPETRNCALGVVGYSVERPRGSLCNIPTPAHDLYIAKPSALKAIGEKFEQLDKAERDMITGDVEGFFAVHGGPELMIVSPNQLKALQAIADGAKSDMRKASLATAPVQRSLDIAARDCICVPRAYEVLQELYSACVLNTLDENHLRQAAAIIARHLGEPVPDARQKVFTLHTKQLESGEWECRVQTIDKWMAAVVTGRTREEAEAAGEKIGAVL